MFFDFLSQVPEKKDLVIDAQLMKPLDHIAGATFLKVRGLLVPWKCGHSQLTKAAPKGSPESPSDLAV